MLGIALFTFLAAALLDLARALRSRSSQVPAPLPPDDSDCCAPNRDDGAGPAAWTLPVGSSLVVYGTAFLLLALVAAFSFRSVAVAPSETVRLPIEVIAPDGASSHAVSISVDVTDPSGIDSLYLQGHHLGYHKSSYAEQNGYDTKASFRVNQGAWTPISNATSTCRYPEKEYNCIGGPYNTLRLRVDATQSGTWTSGTNTIEFRFNGTEGISSGYRILDLDVLAGDQSRVGSTTFAEVDPDSWSPTYTDSEALKEGRNLYQQRDLLVEGPNGPDLVASCADCHARDGRDLWYYNFSSHSIQARARFHGLTQTQAEKISSWIRSLPDGPDGDRFDLPTGVTVGDLGRPWDPPYQPGPGVDDRPVEQWAAGAGLEWVLDTDAQTKDYLFTDGVESGSAQSIASTNSTLSVREIPLAIPFPDILEWWPDYHPLDIYGKSTVLNSDVWAEYQDILALEDPALRDQEIQDAATGDKRFSGIRSYFDDFHRGGSPFSPTGRFADGGDLEKLAALSFQQWQLMKTWEAMHRYDLEAVAPTILPGRTDEIRDDRSTVPGGEQYQWFHQNQIAWWAAPHMNARPDYPGDAPYPTPEQNRFFSHTWYQLQMTLNPGSRWPNGNKPMDWKYHFDHVAETSLAYGVPAGWRYTLSYVKMLEMYDTGKPIDGSSWFIRHSHPRWMFRTGKGRQAMWDAMGTDYLDVLELITQVFLETSIGYADSTPDDDPYGAEAWPRGGSASDLKIYEVEPEDYEPSTTDGFHHTCCRANGFYKMADVLDQRGARTAVVDKLARWGESLWPRGNWEQWMLDAGRQDVELTPGWNLISSHVAPQDDDMVAVFSAIESDLVLVQDEDGKTYDPSGSNDIGAWQPEAGYEVFLDAGRTLTIEGSDVSGTQTIDLSTGWNYIAYLPDTAMPVEDAFSSIQSKLAIVKDEQGNTYVPALGIDDIGRLQPGQGYKVYLREAVSFSYPAP